ncbi:deazapurine DNA modification protein DpdA family protein [Nonomuraea sp. ZG12]|uniref:deazapurine DNA modification protein DpdA family protein n=1 Tax=Nonomuraea sp. ZG12 TaxID=3452207 RepID=UPI003F8A4880
MEGVEAVADRGTADVPVFVTGLPEPSWLARVTFPAMISYGRLARRPLPRQLAARCPTYVDSRGFTELQNHGRWTVTPHEYVNWLRRHREQINLRWAAPQDWMCEPAIIHGGRYGRQTFVGTHLSVPEHQQRTVDNYLTLRQLAPDLNIFPVVQGWELDDYVRCVELYTAAGVDLTALPLVGVGSVCRRQSTAEIGQIVTTLAGLGLRLHGFGVKTLGLQRYGRYLISADSMAWSKDAFHSPPLPGCTHRNCANCLRYAIQWRSRLMTKLHVQHHNQRQDDHAAPSHPAGTEAA